ncbi:26167_t:CDS:2, partial [Racocetra persica]
KEKSDKSGNLLLDKSGNMSITLEDTSTQQTTLISTVDGGYAILNANFTNDGSSLLAKRGGLYASFISYNLSLPLNQAQLYQVTLNNITYNGLYCDYAILAGTVINVKLIKDIPNVTDLFKQSWKMKTMPFGGYILENTVNNIHYIYPYNDETDTQIPSPIQFDTNSLDVTAIMRNNNTFLLASPYTNNGYWSLLTTQLPKVLNRANDYGNIQISDINPSNGAYIDSSTNGLKITFYKPVLLSTGNITIYRASDGNKRQITMAMMTDQCSISPDGLTVSIKVIGSTFNEYGEKYYIQMDANFVKDKNLSEPLSGINKGIEAAIGIAQFTTSATTRFEALSQDDKTKYFDTLLNEISEKVPVRRDRLTTDGNFQYVYSGYDSNIKNIQFSIRINLTDKVQRENTVPGIVKDLDNMIRYKSITTFSNGLTNDLDSTYGFKTKGGLLGDYEKAIIPLFLAAAANSVVYLMSQTGNKKEAEQLGKKGNKAEGMVKNLKEKADKSHIKVVANVFSGGLFVFSHSAFSTTFSFSDVNSKPEFSLP